MSNDPEKPGVGAEDLLGRWLAHHDKDAADSADSTDADATPPRPLRVPTAARLSEAAAPRATRPSAATALAEMREPQAVARAASLGARRGLSGAAVRDVDIENVDPDRPNPVDFEPVILRSVRKKTEALEDPEHKMRRGRLGRLRSRTPGPAEQPDPHETVHLAATADEPVVAVPPPVFKHPSPAPTPAAQPTKVVSYEDVIARAAEAAAIPVVEPEPPVRQPEPHVQPEPQAFRPEPQVQPEPQAFRPEPQVQPEPQVRQPEPPAFRVEPEPQVRQPEPQAFQPEPQVRQPAPQVRQPEPPAFRVEPEPQVQPEPPVRQPAPQVRQPEPPAFRVEPQVRQPAPQVRQPEPPAFRVEPQVQPEPPVRQPEPQVRQPAPQVRQPEPQVRQPEPPAFRIEPQVQPEPPVRQPEPPAFRIEPQVRQPAPQVRQPEPQVRPAPVLPGPDTAPATAGVEAPTKRRLVTRTKRPRPATSKDQPVQQHVVARGVSAPTTGTGDAARGLLAAARATTPVPPLASEIREPKVIEPVPMIPVATVVESEPSAPPMVLPPVYEFAPRRSMRRFLSLMLLSGLVASGYLGYGAYLTKESSDMGIAGIVTLVTLVIWAIRAGATVPRLTVRGGQLEIVRQGNRLVFDLTSTYMVIKVSGRPGRRNWKVQFIRPGVEPVTVNSAMVDGRDFMRVLGFFRPDLVG